MGRERFKGYENLVYVSQIGIMMIVPVFAGVYIGSYLDERFQTGNIFLIICIILGVATSFLNLYKIAVKKSKGK